jgi:hypothetical protein
MFEDIVKIGDSKGGQESGSRYVRIDISVVDEIRKNDITYKMTDLIEVLPLPIEPDRHFQQVSSYERKW